MPPGLPFGSAQPYLEINNEKVQVGMPSRLTLQYPGRLATPSAAQTRDGFPTVPPYESLAYLNEKQAAYLAEGNRV